MRFEVTNSNMQKMEFEATNSNTEQWGFSIYLDWWREIEPSWYLNRTSVLVSRFLLKGGQKRSNIYWSSEIQWAIPTFYVKRTSDTFNPSPFSRSLPTHMPLEEYCDSIAHQRLSLLERLSDTSTLGRTWPPSAPPTALRRWRELDVSPRTYWKIQRNSRY